MITFNDCMPCPQCQKLPTMTYDNHHEVEIILIDGKVGRTHAPRFIIRCCAPSHDHMVMGSSISFAVQFWNRYVQGLLANCDLLRSRHMTKTDERIFNSAHGIDPKEAA